MDTWPRRKHVRMREFDYRTPGAYFFTICLQERKSLFGEVREGVILLNDIGEMLLNIWNTTKTQFPNVEPDALILMPDHAHGNVMLKGLGDNICPTSFIDVIRWFKSVTTIEYGRGVGVHGWPRYNGKFWQRDYLERYLRNEWELDQKRSYIAGNPARWEAAARK